MENIFNNIFPQKCLFCGKSEGSFCKSCLTQCKALIGGYCIICDKPSAEGKTHEKCIDKYKKCNHGAKPPVQVISCFQYQGLVRICIKKSKYYSKLFSAMKDMLNHGLEIVKDEILQIPGIKEFVVISVPSSAKKLKWRGFNQADVIANTLCRRFILRKDFSILNRISGDKAQFEIGREKRFKNVKGVFFVAKNKKAKLKGKKILLVDDICTTGATLLEVSKVLYAEGASEVRCFTLSKKLKNTGL